MSVGIYGGIANNMYVFAKAMREQGADVCFIRDRYDRYPFSQPVWEDGEFRLTLDEMAQASAWGAAEWTAFEEKVGWRAPSWFFDPPAAPSPAVPAGSLLFRRYLRAPHRAAVLAKMRECDALLVCGIEGSVLAASSGRPYVIWPFGADMMVAAGRMPLPSWWQIRHRTMVAAERRWLKAAFAAAACVGSHEPTGIQTSYFGAERYIRSLKVEFLPIPIPVRPRPPAAERRQWFDGFPAQRDRLIGFVPSRVDYTWKGHDMLLRAVAGLSPSASSRIHLVFTGWGSDHAAASRFAAEKGIAATFLDAALSKPLLFRAYQAADFVVDQFKVGMYGTAALEAMACGTPLLTWLNTAFERPWGIPPVINAGSESEIKAALEKIAAGAIDLEATGRQLQQWLARVHDAKAVTAKLLERLAC
jgi:glycosyltransferase involved in cell wall biosynthesis